MRKTIFHTLAAIGATCALMLGAAHVAYGATVTVTTGANPVNSAFIGVTPDPGQTVTGVSLTWPNGYTTPVFYPIDPDPLVTFGLNGNGTYVVNVTTTTGLEQHPFGVGGPPEFDAGPQLPPVQQIGAINNQQQLQQAQENAEWLLTYRAEHLELAHAWAHAMRLEGSKRQWRTAAGRLAKAWGKYNRADQAAGATGSVKCLRAKARANAAKRAWHKPGQWKRDALRLERQAAKVLRHC